MPCNEFATLTEQFPEMPTRYGNGDVGFCDRWLAVAVDHAVLLRRRYETAHGTPYQSTFGDRDWDEVAAATRQTPIQIRLRLMHQNWPGTLMRELEDLEAKVAH